MTGQSALVLGATGAVGRHILTELLSSPHFSKVGEYGRKVTPADTITSGSEKLQQKTIDFEKLNESGLKDGKWDVVFIALGTSRAAAGSAAAFEKIDREYVINAARAAKSDDATHPQRLVYLSSGGADSSSHFLYPRSKGLTQDGLASLGYSDTIVFQPGLLTGRANPKPVEIAASWITGPLSYITSSLEISVTTLAKSIVTAGRMGSSALPNAVGAKKVQHGPVSYTVISNAGALKLAETAA